MIKAIFIDYSGTILQLRGPEYDEMVNYLMENSTLKTKEEVQQWYYEKRKVLEAESFGESFETQEELLFRICESGEREVRLKADKNLVRTYLQNTWMYAPVFSDVKQFFDLCPLPIYILMDNNSDYAKVCMRRNGLHPHGIVSGEDVKAYKPRKEVFDKALELADCAPDEVLHIGDDLYADIEGAENAGIEAVLLDRYSRHRGEKCRRMRSLSEVLAYIERNSEK